MAFSLLVESNKQHLNLSLLAYDVIQNDMFTFGNPNLSSFINTVFENYYPTAEVSVSRTLNKLEGELSKLLADVTGDTAIKERIVKRIIFKKTNDLLKKAGSYGSGHSFKFWINKSNNDYLTTENSECKEDKYYTTRGKYIKCVIEEYARLPYVERERIYYNDRIEEAKKAINKECQLRVETQAGNLYSVHPFELRCDPLSIANYIVGYCQRYDTNDDLRPCSFRISAIKSIRVETSKSGHLNKDERTSLLQAIALRGVQFLATTDDEIHVKLSKEGEQKFKRQLHLRPTLVEKRPDNVYIFRCTPAQAEFYFFKFGKDAEILFPLPLRNKFLEMYSQAKVVYENEKEKT